MDDTTHALPLALTSANQDDATQTMPPALTQSLPIRPNPPAVGVPLALTSFWATLANHRTAIHRDQAARIGELPRLVREYHADADAAYAEALAAMPEGGPSLRAKVQAAMIDHRKLLSRAVIAAADAPWLAIAADAAAVPAAEPQPAAPVIAAAPLPDGPCGFQRFRWGGREYGELTPRADKLLRHVWPLPDRAGAYDDACLAMYPDETAESMPAEPLAGARKDANDYFARHEIPLCVRVSSGAAGRVAIVAK